MSLGPSALPLILLCPLWSTSCAGGPARDSIPQSRDVRVLDAGLSSPPSSQGYEYVAKRPLAMVALAEARGISPEVAREAIDRIADALDACATDQQRQGAAAEGAARVVAAVEPDGSVGPPTVRVDPGEGVARSAIVCFVAPVRLLRFPPVDAGARGIAVEALWGTLVAREK